MAATLDAVDAELTAWRDRLAAASRNVSELSELPEYAIAKQITTATGRVADEARGLVATMAELWQGVLLIGAALDRAETARTRGFRLWRGSEAAAEAMSILHGPSVTVDLSDTPVLHRRLLAGPRATATVSPETLLQTMEVAFDRARDQLTRITEATGRADALQARLAASVAALPTGPLSARLAECSRPDPLDRLEALEALRPAIDAASAEFERARSGLAAARSALAALTDADATARREAELCQAAVTVPLPGATAVLPELTAWLERLTQTLAAGRLQGCAIGLANWLALHHRAAAETGALATAATAALTRRDELRARLGGLRAKHRARPAPHADPLAAAAKAAVERDPMDIASAAAALGAYQAALAAPSPDQMP
jgi:hypothetical protein